TMCTCCSFKCWFIFFNSLFLASGIALIAIGALQYSTYTQIGTFAGSSLSRIAVVLIVVGVAIVLISLLGHVGAFLDNSSMLACFICILIVIILLEVFSGAAFYIFLRRVRHFRCCGADSYADWYKSKSWGNPKAVPDSCCAVKREGCGQDKRKIHTKGCITAIKIFLLRNLVWVGAVCIALGIVLVGVCLCMNIKRKKYEHLN
uniref:Tetraspanin n=1 Tax=Anabas testudineus TaxID=64144 RepID=A0A3Q1JQ47_ANATE